jgi:hypothetical protein
VSDGVDSDKCLTGSFPGGLYPDVSRSLFRTQERPRLADQIPAPFPHRKNEDGSFDSICPVCFRTVACRVRESQLAELERGHICEDMYISGSPFLAGRSS